MAVGELIERLSTFELGLTVLRGDNSGGYEAIYSPRHKKDVVDGYAKTRPSRLLSWTRNSKAAEAR